MKTRLYSYLIALCLALPSLRAADSSASMPSEVVKTVSATIQAINLETREVTLKGPQGNVFTVTADPAIMRLNEFKAGDDIVLDYSVSVASEIRPPTEAEKANPLVVTEHASRSEPGHAPRVDAYRIIEVVATVEGLDRPTQTATLKGPRGNYVLVKVKDPAKLLVPHIGDTVFVVYSESIALRLEKPPVKSAAH